jgi:hypothetical protein
VAVVGEEDEYGIGQGVWKFEVEETSAGCGLQMPSLPSNALFRAF